jgi:spore coat protein U-like protein
VWGDGTGGSATVTGTGAGLGALSTQTLTVHGHIADSASNQQAAPGSYGDVVTVTVEY